MQQEYAVFDMSPSNGYAGSPTIVQTGFNPARAASRSWAISAIVLALIQIMFQVGFWLIRETPDKHLAPPPMPAGPIVATGLAMLAYLVLPVGFLAGGIGMLKRGDWGRQLLAGIAPLGALASVMGTLGFVMIARNQAFLGYCIASASIHHPDLDWATTIRMMDTAAIVSIGMVVFAASIQVVYCALLFRHTLSNQARLATRLG